MGTPYKRATDSPSRQLLYELNQLAISSQEGFYAHLEDEDEDRRNLHKQALAAAALKHDRVRRNAEAEKQRVEAEEEARRLQQEEEQRRALEKQRHENELAVRRREIEREQINAQRERELARARQAVQEVADRRKAEKEHHDAEEARKRQERFEAEKERQKASAAAEARAKQQAIEAERAKGAQTQASTIAPKPAPIVPTSAAPKSRPADKDPERESIHARYLQIHQELKDLRKMVASKLKEFADVKAAVGEMRREIKKSVGQLTADNRKKPLHTIISVLRKALAFPEPKINIVHLLAKPPSNLPPDPTGPAVLVYLLNIFAKAIIAQFVDEASVNPKAADSVGIVASHIFALPDFQWNGWTLIDILLAKFHVVAPAIFGIYGPENSAEGKLRLGWWREGGRHDGAFVPAQRHFERMTGLGAGFAALALRNYEKAKVQNPFPDRHYWEALAGIGNLSPAQLTLTHLVLLKGLIEHFEGKFIGLYGGAAVAALRHLLVDLPRKCPPSAPSKSLAGLVDVLRREKKLVL